MDLAPENTVWLGKLQKFSIAGDRIFARCSFSTSAHGQPLHGVLVSESSRAPLRLAFPAALASRWMPGLFPTGLPKRHRSTGLFAVAPNGACRRCPRECPGTPLPASRRASGSSWQSPRRDAPGRGGFLYRSLGVHLWMHSFLGLMISIDVVVLTARAVPASRPPSMRSARPMREPKSRQAPRASRTNNDQNESTSRPAVPFDLASHSFGRRGPGKRVFQLRAAGPASSMSRALPSITCGSEVDHCRRVLQGCSG